MYQADQVVNIKLFGNPDLIRGKVIRCEYHELETYYWVKHKLDISIFSAKELNQWNTDTYSNGCECGSATVKSSRHSHYCPKFLDFQC